ncbi:hydratase, partial [Desulfovibrio sp. OttesenSCG-928-G15]|nr:hydratase [Desulfovibrio sp. OttesenSCG-928-G15]
YRANLVNWGMLPFVLENAAEVDFAYGDKVVICGIRSALESGKTEVEAVLQRGDTQTPLRLLLPGLTNNERAIILSGCLINNYAGK